MRKIKRPKTGGSPFFFLKEGIKNIWVNGFMSFAAISIIAICILIMGSFTLIALNVNKTVVDIRSASQIRVFIDTSIEADEYNSIKTEILNLNDVRDAVYMSKEDAFLDFKAQLGEESNMLDGLEEDNPLRDGYIVYLHTLDNVNIVTEDLANVKGVANVESDNVVYTALSNLEHGVQIISFILVCALAGVSIFIIANTVKLAMFNRKSEIAIMKMIGATDGFIRWPFVVEGLILGIFGASIAFGLQWLIYNQSIVLASQYIGFVDILNFDTIILTVLAMFMGAGAIIGTLGSVLTIRRFLDV